MAQPAAAQAQNQGALSFFKNYFVTGDYVVGGVGLRGKGVLDPVTGEKLASGQISIAGVPSDADVVAAVLYWQAMESEPAAFKKGYFRDSPVLGKQIAPEGVDSCWSSGGGAGSTSGASFLRSYRANVLHLLPTDPATGKRIVVGSHTVKVPDSGSGGSQSPSSGNQVNLAEGATLLVVYRDASKPLRAIIVYDGARILNQQTPAATITQSIYGYFQASTAGANARVTHIVGDGDPNFGEQLTVTGTSSSPVVSNPFPGSLGFSWDNPTYNVPLTAGTLQESAPITSTVAATGSAIDCLSWTAMIAGVDVQDQDYDGLLDRWETSASTLSNPDGELLPPINLMGANETVQDIFVEIGYLNALSGYSTPLGAVTAHSHLPSKDVLFAVATMFHNAKTAGARKFGVTGPINLHFDVGNRYQPPVTNPPFNYSVCQTASTWQPQCSIIPSTYARGGEEIDELLIESDAFPGFRGVIGWKSAFDLLRDKPLTLSEKACAAATSCERRFDQNRRHTFRYALFGHVLGVPRFDNPAIPRSTSGVADGGAGGGDLLITLGLWDDFKGTDFVQAGTLAHELGHATGLRHAGPPPTPTDKAPNCKPNYLSAMNYFFQMRGLALPPGAAIDPTRGGMLPLPAPRAVIDFSRDVHPTVYEKSLSDIVLASPYLTRWYAPLGGTWLETLGTQKAERYCDGTPATGLAMVRVDGTLPGAIDWNINGVSDAGPATAGQDVNYNGTTAGIAGASDVAKGEKLTGFNDWANVDLRHTAARRNFNGLSLEMTLEDAGVFDRPLGAFDWGAFDWGAGGAFDWGAFDWGAFDWGAFDWGAFDWGAAEGAFDWGGPLDSSPRGDIDFTTAASHGNPPTNLRYVATNKSIDLSWDAPTVAKAAVGDTYRIWRAPANVPISNSNPPLEVGSTTVSLTNPARTFSDTTAKNNTLYWYFVTVTVNGKQSPPSEIIQAIK